MKPVNLRQKLALFTKQWHPHVIAEGDSLQVYLSKIQGEFVMHKHDAGDELFYVIKGAMEMRFEDRDRPRQGGRDHSGPPGSRALPPDRPTRKSIVLVVEPRGTTHTGNVEKREDRQGIREDLKRRRPGEPLSPFADAAPVDDDGPVGDERPAVLPVVFLDARPASD